MEWNSNPTSLWEWENLFEFEAKSNGNPKKLHQRTDCSFEKDRDVSSGSPGSDFGHASSKSSVSASINSSSMVESKASNHKSAPDGFEGQIKAQQLDVLAGSGEPLLSLKLGKRMYFKDICSESNVDSNGATVKRGKLAGHGTLVPHCQVEGCNLDLSSAKDYHRKHRICEAHSKSSRVVVNGVERRFCQQCSRFHGLAEFDEKKRSCRRRLSDHNARRRKPQPEAVRLNPARYSSLYEETQKMSLVFDPHLYSRHAGNVTRVHSSESSKFGPTREFLSSSITTLYPHDSARLVPNKAIVPEFLHSGFEESVVTSEHDLHRALSLLSNSSQESKPTSLNLANHNSGSVPPAMHQIAQGMPVTSSEYWHTIDTEPAIALPRGNPSIHLQDHHLFKASRDSGLYSYQLN